VAILEARDVDRCIVVLLEYFSNTRDHATPDITTYPRMTLFSPDRIIGPLRANVTDFGGDVGLTSTFYYEPDCRGLCVLIPPWKVDSDSFKVVRKRVREAGYSCLEYKIESSLLSPDHEYTKKAFMEVINTVTADIKRMVERHGFKKVQVIGISIGSLEAMMIANHNPFVTRLVLVAPGDNLAESMWYGLKTQNIRKLYEEQGVTLPFLKDVWRGLSPESDFAGLKGKEIEVYISKADVNVPYRFGRRLVDQMTAHGLNPVVIENRFLGHYLTVVKYLMYPMIR